MKGEGDIESGEERVYRVVVPIQDRNWVEGGRGFAQVRFWYEEGRDVWGCPEGGELRRVRDIHRKRKVEYRTYQCAAFRSCWVVHFCTKAKRRKVLAVPAYREAMERQKDRWVRALIARRKQIGGPVFGVSKRMLLGLEKFREPGYRAYLAFNLRKLY